MAGQPVPTMLLSDLPAGGTARLHHDNLDASTSGLLRALGLTSASELRVCKAGEPFIIQVRATRIGLARVVAQQIHVIPLPVKDPQP